MPKIDISVLSGPALDWAVAKCEGFIGEDGEVTFDADLVHDSKTVDELLLRVRYSTNWKLAGDIIDRERIRLDPRESSWHAQAWDDDMTEVKYSPTALIAAMRCYVKSKLGALVEVPKGLPLTAGSAAPKTRNKP